MAPTFLRVKALPMALKTPNTLLYPIPALTSSHTSPHSLCTSHSGSSLSLSLTSVPSVPSTSVPSLGFLHHHYLSKRTFLK